MFWKLRRMLLDPYGFISNWRELISLDSERFQTQQGGSKALSFPLKSNVIGAWYDNVI